MSKSCFCVVEVASSDSDERHGERAHLRLVRTPPFDGLGAATAVDEHAALPVDEHIRHIRIEQVLAQGVDRRVVG